MWLLVAPDKFKGTLSADQAARAIAAGWHRSRSEDHIDQLPMADGGEGTMEALVSALGGERHRVRVTGPLGDPVDAEYGLVRGPEGLTAVVEMASASGLGLIAESRRDPRRTSTRGTGELVLAALEHRPERVILCIGGSATNDGGAGMAQALGAKLLDGEGAQIPGGGEGLLALERIDVGSLDPRARSAKFSVACDVDNPFVGPSGASAVYGPQKGASPEDVILLDRALGHLAAVVRRDLGLDVRDTPGAGAAGGLGGGMIAFLGARLRPGIDLVMEAVGFGAHLAAADAVITGEGSFDRQSLHGKTAIGIADASLELGLPVAILCGRSEVERDGVLVRSLASRYGMDRAMADTRAALDDLAAELAGSWPGHGK